MLFLSKIDSKPKCEYYLKEQIELIPRSYTVAYVSEKLFLLPKSIKDNILFYSPYREDDFKYVLQLTQLDDFKETILSKENKRVNDRLSNYYKWHVARIELARALYNKVDYLFINRAILLQDE